ncbi:MAG: uracil phosphoribosyltransferase [Candidatus Obscuribacterales bacterium]|nr:uracil phosphoribosyltransferase [Candidatus Obscuribacterales bacterium]
MIGTNTKVRIVDHPLAQQTLTRLRDLQTPSQDFRRLASRLSRFLVYESMVDLKSREVGVETPVGPGKGVALTDYIILAPVLRAGLILSEAAQDLFPSVRIYHVGLKRDEETLEAKSYYAKLPESLPPDCRVFVLDPMLATGGSAVAAISLFDKLEVKAIDLVCFVAAPEGIERVHSSFPNVSITTASVDDNLNQHGYIVPGLGDAGDRIFGT